MPRTNHQKIIDVDSDREFPQQSVKRADSENKRVTGQAKGLAPIDVRCHLVSDKTSLLFDGFSDLIRSASNDWGFNTSNDGGALQLRLIPHDMVEDDGLDSWADLHGIRLRAADESILTVVVSNNPAAARRIEFPPNVLKVIGNDDEGVASLRRLIRRIEQRRHQKLWLVGDENPYLAELFTNLGFPVQSVDKLHQITGLDECVTLRNCSCHVILVSCGRKSYVDYDTCPSVIKAALNTNDLFSMHVIIDDAGIDLKSQWEDRGVSITELKNLKERELVDSVSSALHVQHQLALLHNDVIRSPSTGIYNKTYLDDCGRRLHAMASRGNLFFAVVVVQFRLSDSLSEGIDSELISVINTFVQTRLREYDVVAQRFSGELVCLLTSVGNLTLSAVLDRLSNDLQKYLEHATKQNVRVAVGATNENGVSFDAMIHRATMAALQCNMPGAGAIVVL